MIIIKLLFIVLIVICAVFYILYVWNFSLVLLVIFSVLPVIMYIITFIVKKKTTAEFALKNTTALKNESFPVQLCVTNNSIFPIGKAEAHIEYYNIFNNKINSFEMYFPMQSKNTQRITFQISSKYCGILKIRSAYIKIFDPLRIFKMKTGKNVCTQIAVMPEGFDVDGTVTFTDKIIEESSKFSETQPGDDPSEVFDLREYVPGDKLNRIHWKLSSKKDEFIVKDYSLPVDVPCTLFLNLVCYEDSDYTLPVFDALLESLLSISRFMLENERVHNIVYYDSFLKKFNEVTVTDHDILSETISRIILSVNDNLFCEKPELYFTEHPLSLSSFTFITSMPNVSVFDIIENEIDADIKNAVVALRPDESLPAVCPDIRFIPVKTGKISSSLTDIEL